MKQGDILKCKKSWIEGINPNAWLIKNHNYIIRFKDRWGVDVSPPNVNHGCIGLKNYEIETYFYTNIKLSPNIKIL